MPCYRILALPHPTWRSTHAPGSRIEITNDLCQSASKQHAPLPLPLPEIMPRQQQEVRCKTNQISYLHDDTTKSNTSIKNFNVCDRNDYKPLQSFYELAGIIPLICITATSERLSKQDSKPSSSTHQSSLAAFTSTLKRYTSMTTKEVPSRATPAFTSNHGANTAAMHKRHKHQAASYS